VRVRVPPVVLLFKKPLWALACNGFLVLEHQQFKTPPFDFSEVKRRRFFCGKHFLTLSTIRFKFVKKLVKKDVYTEGSSFHKKHTFWNYSNP
jgi:hypothetical protein